MKLVKNLATNQHKKKSTQAFDMQNFIASNANIIVSQENFEGVSLVRHFAIENQFKSIIYIDFTIQNIQTSLACSLYNVEEFIITDIKTLNERVHIDSSMLIVISSNSLKWLESIMFLRRNFQDLKVYFSGSQKFILSEEKILSKYHENFSGVIMKQGNQYDREYSHSLLSKRFSSLPLIFLSDGVMKISMRHNAQAA